mmetsp:Transcript_54556/g.173342  ORF Transcript_54556/g.173342 Transcript_54556/m.173342 type:complete len:484 (-) Transcript_54556:752-2203(-)
MARGMVISAGALAPSRGGTMGGGRLRCAEARGFAATPRGRAAAVARKRSGIIMAASSSGNGGAVPLPMASLTAQVPNPAEEEEEYVFEMEIPRPPFIPDTWPPELVLGGAIAFLLAGAMTAIRAPAIARLITKAVKVIASSVSGVASAAKPLTASASKMLTPPAGGAGVAAGLEVKSGRVAEFFKTAVTLAIQVSISSAIALWEAIKYFWSRITDAVGFTGKVAAPSAKAEGGKKGGVEAMAAGGGTIKFAPPQSQRPPPGTRVKIRKPPPRRVPKAKAAAPYVAPAPPASEVAKTRGEARAAPVTSGHVLQLKSNLLRCVAGLDRGFAAGELEQADVERACAALQDTCPPPAMDELLGLLDGKWQLVYSSAFAPHHDPAMADINGGAVSAPLVVAGTVWQDIMPEIGRLENIVTLKGPSLPFLPAFETKVHLGHAMAPSPPHSVKITTETATLDIGNGNKLPLMSLPEVAESIQSLRDMRSA